jgi:hypothetical protein
VPPSTVNHAIRRNPLPLRGIRAPVGSTALPLYAALSNLRVIVRGRSPGLLNYDCSSGHREYNTDILMRPLIWFARIFIDAFGITHPSPEEERRVAIFIASLLGFFVIVVFGIIFAVYHFSH